jgi:hypothetical protein
MRKTLMVLVFLVLSVGLPKPEVFAYTVLEHTWSKSSIPWYIHPSGSNDAAFNELKNALQDAFQEFQKLSCFSKSFSYGGTSSNNPEDGIYIQFKESNWDPTVGDAAAYAQTWTNWSGSASHSVIVFNGVDLEWTTTEADDFFSLKTDIQGVATHELGHCLGLGHSRVRKATMFFSGGSAELRSLDQDDKNGICFLYSSFTGGQPCDACEADDNCSGGYCVTYPDGGSFCGKDCVSDSNCPDNFYCYDLQGMTDQCAAINSYCSQTGSNIPVGLFCYGHDTCKEGKCMVVPDDAYCTKDCTSDSQCPGDTKCIADLCLLGGSTPLGGECDYHTDCESGMCIGLSDTEAVCTLTCTEQADCPAGFGCSSGYCLQGGGKPYGQSCDYEMECDSITCLKVGNSKICTELCDDSADCPYSDPCTYGICIPPGSGAFNTKCTSHMDCKSGFCAGMSNKFCSLFCDSDGDCPDDAKCGSSDYCVPQQAPSDQCFNHGDCSSDMFCEQPSAGAAGTCMDQCNPFADAGCDEWYDCKWHYISWEDEVLGKCVVTNDGGKEEYYCDVASDPCLPSLYCANVGGIGAKCYRDCDLNNSYGCMIWEQCLSLGISSDPRRGVCICADPSCMDQPTEDVTSQPDSDLVSEPDSDNPGSPDSSSVQPGSDTGNSTPATPPPGGTTGGCATTRTGHSSAILLLLMLLLGLFLRRSEYS